LFWRLYFCPHIKVVYFPCMCHSWLYHSLEELLSTHAFTVHFFLFLLLFLSSPSSEKCISVDNLFKWVLSQGQPYVGTGSGHWGVPDKCHLHPEHPVWHKGGQKQNSYSTCLKVLRYRTKCRETSDEGSITVYSQIQGNPDKGKMQPSFSPGEDTQ
jgi:hypothetical protein